MHYSDNNYEQSEIFSEKIRAGKRTYMLDVRATRGNDYYITITERKRNFNGDGYTKQKIFLYKEDFNKFLRSLQHVMDHVKQELMPDYDFDQFDRERENQRSAYEETEPEDFQQ
ncbi:MAG: DUF3276 family protein [Bacteroidetes bacterium]|nr:DUF3276 family protein [Bacteroidota bacterium]